jgi:hypothetical protein
MMHSGGCFRAGPDPLIPRQAPSPFVTSARLRSVQPSTEPSPTRPRFSF